MSVLVLTKGCIAKSTVLPTKSWAHSADSLTSAEITLRSHRLCQPKIARLIAIRKVPFLRLSRPRACHTAARRRRRLRRAFCRSRAIATISEPAYNFLETFTSDMADIEDDRDSTKTKSSATISASERPPTTSESTPLLPKAGIDNKPQWGKSVVLRVLFTAFLVSVSFSITQVPMIYSFGLMTCEEYYLDKSHPDPGPVPNRCRNPAIEASTARAVALVGAGTTVFGVLNLFFTGWAIKRFGIKPALLTSVFWPAIRLAVQNIGVQMGYGLGITIIQASQIITVVGGPAGYLLALNSFATEIVPSHERTATLGRLTGCSFFGTALGYLFGGLLSDAFGVPAPFEVTLILFIVSCIYIAIALPSVPLHLTPENEKKSRSLWSFFEPLKMFVPRKWMLENGRVKKEHGVLLLGVGASLAVLATG